MKIFKKINFTILKHKMKKSTFYTFTGTFIWKYII